MDKINVRIKLSLLWVALMLNMIFADVLSLYVIIVDNIKPDIPGDVKTIMAIAAVIHAILIFMIYFSAVLEYKINRILNIIVALLTIVYIVGPGDTTPHYMVVAATEIIIAITIITIAVKWKKE